MNDYCQRIKKHYVSINLGNGKKYSYVEWDPPRDLNWWCASFFTECPNVKTTEQSVRNIALFNEYERPGMVEAFRRVGKLIE